MSRRLPYGMHYTGLTEAGLTRENGYVANYGESANYLVTYFYKTLNHAGDENMNDEILKAALKSVHAADLSVTRLWMIMGKESCERSK